jgi:hypothetical protein
MWHCNIGLHIASLAAGDVTYCLMRMVDGGRNISVERRNMQTGALLPDKSFLCRTQDTIRLTSGELHDGRRVFDPRDGLLENRLHIIVPAAMDYSTPGGVPTWTPRAGPDDVLRLSTFDSNQDVVAGYSVDIRVDIPGETTGPAVPTDAPTGFGGRIGWERTSGLEENYSTKVTINGSGSGKLEDSAAPAFELLANGDAYFPRYAGFGTRTPEGVIEFYGIFPNTPVLYFNGTAHEFGIPADQQLTYGRFIGGDWTTLGGLIT